VDKLRLEFEKMITISDAEWQEVVPLFKYRQFKKGEIFHYGGEIMNNVYYLSKGIAKSYFYGDNGKEFVWQIYYNHASLTVKNAMMDDCVSFYEQNDSLLTFEALEDVECYEISWKALEALYVSHSKWQYVGRVLTQGAYANAYKRIVSIMSQDSSSRYEALLAQYPNIFEYVKAYHIASYLGITPQSLSRLRKKLP